MREQIGRCKIRSVNTSHNQIICAEHRSRSRFPDFCSDSREGEIGPKLLWCEPGFKELDSHAKHGQSFPKRFGCMTEYFCAKYTLCYKFQQVFVSMALHDVIKVGIPYMGTSPGRACARINLDCVSQNPCKLKYIIDPLKP